MSDHPPYEDDDWQAPPGLTEALRRLPPTVRVPPEVDSAILLRARQCLSGKTARPAAGQGSSPADAVLATDIFKWLRRLAAVAACVLVLMGADLLFKPALHRRHGRGIQPMIVPSTNLPLVNPQSLTNSPGGGHSIRPVVIPGN